jgi:hypothetical protein
MMDKLKDETKEQIQDLKLNILTEVEDLNIMLSDASKDLLQMISDKREINIKFETYLKESEIEGE